MLSDASTCPHPYLPALSPSIRQNQIQQMKLHHFSYITLSKLHPFLDTCAENKCVIDYKSPQQLCSSNVLYYHGDLPKIVVTVFFKIGKMGKYSFEPDFRGILRE